MAAMTLNQPFKKPSLAGPPLPSTQPAAMTNTLPQPIAPAPIVGPTLPGSPTAPPLNFTPPTIGPAPTATPYAAFTPPTGPDPYQFRVDQANKGAQRSAAARGTLLSGGFQTSLARMNQGMAAEETQNVYNRAANTYGMNRETNQQNFGQSLAGYQAGTGAALDAGRLNLAGATAGYDRTYGAQRDTYGDAVQSAQSQAGVLNANAQAQQHYEQQMEDYRAAVEQQRTSSAAPRPGAPGTRGTQPDVLSRTQPWDPNQPPVYGPWTTPPNPVMRRNTRGLPLPWQVQR